MVEREYFLKNFFDPTFKESRNLKNNAEKNLHNPISFKFNNLSKELMYMME